VTEDRDDRASGAAGRRPAGRASPRRRFRRVVEGPATVESYLRGSSPPRYMQRLRQIENEFAIQRRRLLAAYADLRAALGHDREAFHRRWRAQAHAWRFDRLNDLIREHNTWYPVEANLPMDPRTRNFVPIRGASYRRLELGPEWVLAHLPPTPPGDSEAPEVPVRAPREPLERAPGAGAGQGRRR
jgi:hypothetical protein